MNVTCFSVATQIYRKQIYCKQIYRKQIYRKQTQLMAYE